MARQPVITARPKHKPRRDAAFDRVPSPAVERAVDGKHGEEQPRDAEGESHAKHARELTVAGR